MENLMVTRLAVLAAIGVLLCGCGAMQRQIKSAAHTQMNACTGANSVEKWRCINAILIRENEDLRSPDMDLVQSLAAAHLRIAADQDAARVAPVEAEARHKEAIATAEAEAQRRRANAQVRNAITNRANAETTATYTNMIVRGVEMTEGTRPTVTNCNQFGSTVNCVSR
jgi:hypothetical protein